MRAADAAVLREADTAVGRELTRFDLANRCFNETPVFVALFFRDGCSQILNLGMMFPHEHHERHIADSADP